MSEWLLNIDPVNRAYNTFDYDEASDKIVIRRYWERAEVERVLRDNEFLRNHTTQRGRDIQHAARIPDIVIYEWLHKFGVRIWDKNHQKKVHELLNSNEFYKLRTGGGRL